MEELIKAYDEYIQILTDELDDLVGLAYVHGWKSHRVGAGEDARKKIADAKAKLSQHIENQKTEPQY